MMEQYIRIAEHVARNAGKMLAATQGDFRSAQTKGAIDDIVSSADIDADREIVSVLKKETPFCLLSEESGYEERSSPYVWIVDALDGSSNYVSNISYFGISIGLAEGTRPIGGVIYDPMSDTMYSALENEGAFMNGERVGTADRDISQSILNTDFARGPKVEAARLMGELAERSRYVRVCGSAVIGMMEVVAGRSQAYVHLGLKPWDACAGAGIIQAAGGIVTNKFGESWRTSDASFVAASPSVHRDILKVLKNGMF